MCGKSEKLPYVHFQLAAAKEKHRQSTTLSSVISHPLHPQAFITGFTAPLGRGIVGKAEKLKAEVILSAIRNNGRSREARNPGGRFGLRRCFVTVIKSAYL